MPKTRINSLATKYLDLKKIVIPFMTLVIMVSQMTGCAALSSQEMIAGMEESPTVSIEWAEPDTGQQTSDDSGAITVGDQQFVTDTKNSSTDDSDIGVIDQQQELTELSGDSLHEYFQLAYDSGTALEGDIETRIAGELDILVSLVSTNGTVKLPASYAEDYKAWRPAEAPIEAELFTEVRETVYVTGTNSVNLRSGPGTSYDKVGSLSWGQSATRTGVGIAGTDADGNTVYVSSKYLSTTKPVAQQSTDSKQSTPKPSNNQSDTTPQGSQSNFQSPDDLWVDPFAGMTPEEKEAAIQRDQELQKIADEETRGTMHD